MSTGVLEAKTFSGTFSGNGANIRELDAGNITTGVLAPRYGGTGVSSLSELEGLFGVSPETIAPDYETKINFSISEGEYCTHNGKLYKSTTTIPAGTPWNQNNWNETTLASIIQNFD